MFVWISPTDFCKFDLSNTPTKCLIAKKRDLHIFKIRASFAFEANLLEIEPEDTIRFLHYVHVFSVRKGFVK